MSRWQTWLDSQQRTVEPDGVCASTIRLEAPDGSVWGTWSVKTEELDDVIEAAIEILVEDLPKERHACRLVSYDSKGEQLAIMPHAVMGRSTEAGKTANRDRAHAQATSVHLGNAEQVLGIQFRQLERQAAQQTDLFEDNLVLREKLVGLLSDTLANRANEELARERLQVFKELVATAKPMLESVIAMGAEFATYKFSEMVKGLERKELAQESLTSENERLKQELATLRSQSASDSHSSPQVVANDKNGKPVDGSVPDGAQRTEGSQKNGGRSRQRNSRSGPRNRGGKTATAVRRGE